MSNIDFNKYKGIIYDFDGVILDSVSVKTDAFAEIYKEYGEEIVEKVKEYHLLHGGISRFEKFRYYHTQLLGLEISEDEVQNLASKFNQIAFQKVIESPYILGAKELIEKLSHTHKLFICTGTPENEIFDILENLGLKKYFIGIFGSPTKKTNIIQRIIDEHQIENNSLLYFGDATTDYEASKSFQIDFVGITNGNSSPFPEGTICFENFITLL